MIYNITILFQWINEHREHFENYGKRLNNYKGKIFINGHFATLGASLMLKNSNLNSNQAKVLKCTDSIILLMIIVNRLK